MGAGAISELTEELLFSAKRPPEELYLYNEDRWQTNNLVDDPNHHDALLQHRKEVENWIVRTGDPGDETPEVYTLETEDQMSVTKNKDSRENFRRNSELYKKWAAEGK